MILNSACMQYHRGMGTESTQVHDIICSLDSKTFISGPLVGRRYLRVMFGGMNGIAVWYASKPGRSLKVH
jgi:hypothetical protein